MATTPETGLKIKKLPGAVVKSSKNVVIRSNTNSGRLGFHDLFDRHRVGNPIIWPAAVANTDPELEGANDRRETSQQY
jgi:hypothetical protein